MAMKFTATIKQDGTVVTEVLDRGNHLCSEIYRVTEAVGKQLSDENIGPECGNTVSEVVGGDR
jgi:hypothetical protein